MRDIKDIVSCKPMAIEKALRILRVKIELYNEVKRNEQDMFNNYGGGNMVPYEEPIHNGQQDAVDKLVAEREIDVAKSMNKPPLRSMPCIREIVFNIFNISNPFV